MHTSTARLACCSRFTSRSLFGCGFLLWLPLWPLQAQRGPELSLSGGFSLSKSAITRYQLPPAFQTSSYFNTGAALRLTIPLSTRFGLGLEQRVTGLAQGIRYRYQNGGSRSTGIGLNTIHQSGISLRLYDIARLGPRWNLDALLTGAYSWTGAYNKGTVVYQLLGSEQPFPPRTDAPQVRVEERWLKNGIPTVGTELQLAFELSSRQALFLMVGYQRGVERLLEVRSVRAEFLDEAGMIRQGSLTIITRCSYGTAQLGYALRLSPRQATGKTHSTPRYSLDAEDDTLNTEPPIE
ncbi:hypothetical protein [Hymenobacter sp.]|jgi:hypothetical protein|uniref:hypothetical protein n=1 Tax=Hymenobacter sp. TaxID=1898978 RepID=UPI002ED7E19F